MNIQNILAYEEEKIKLILNFFEKNNINSLDSITFIGAGTYSTVYRINEFVLKIGLAKLREEIIESSYLAKDFLRLNIKFITSQITIVLGIEIQPYVEEYNGFKEEDLFQLYCSLREESLIWTDIKYKNVGIINNMLVVLDVDDVFYDNDSSINWVTPLSRIFEIKYKKERSI